jgi:molecular chaperone HscA
VGAKELTTGLEQQVEVKPSYGLTDEEVERCCSRRSITARSDFEARRLIEERVEAERVVLATKKALSTDADLLSDEERGRIAEAVTALERRSPATSALIHARLELLDRRDQGVGGRRMDRAIAQAIAGKDVASVETSVARAKGVDEHVADHAAREGGRLMATDPLAKPTARPGRRPPRWASRCATRPRRSTRRKVTRAEASAPARPATSTCSRAASC